MKYSKIHGSAAICAGAFFCLLSLSGTSISISTLSSPERTAASTITRLISLDKIQRELQKNYPKLYGPWTFDLPEGATEQIRCTHIQPTSASGVTPPPLTVLADPTTGTLKSQEGTGRSFGEIAYRIHTQMMGGKLGEGLVALTGLFALLIVISGWVSWYAERKGKHINTSTEAATRAAFAHLMHRMLGVTSFPIGLTIVVSGVLLAIPPITTDPDLSHESSTTPIRSTAIPGERSIQIEEAILVARGLFPRASVTHVTPPAGETGTFEIRLCQFAETDCRHRQTKVWVDQNSGQIREVLNPLNSSATEKLTDGLISLHTGETFGLIGKLIWLITGLSPIALFGSGIYRRCILNNWLEDKPLDATVMRTQFHQQLRRFGSKNLTRLRSALNRPKSKAASAIKACFEHIAEHVKRWQHRERP